MQQHGSMVQSADPPDPEGGVKRSKFNSQNMVMLHIKLDGITNAATW